jgi:hypothetical protein
MRRLIWGVSESNVPGGYRKGKGKGAKLSYIGNALTENRHGLVV